MMAQRLTPGPLILSSLSSSQRKKTEPENPPKFRRRKSGSPHPDPIHPHSACLKIHSRHLCQCFYNRLPPQLTLALNPIAETDGQLTYLRS